jgi:PPIC-type PPIASE domain
LLRASFLREPDRSKRTTEVYSAALNSLIEREIVLQDAFKMLKDRGKAGDHMINKLREAAREGFEKEIMKPLKNQLKTDAEIKRYFAEFGTSLTSVRRAWERHFMEFEYLRTMIFPLLETRVNHPMIVEYYETHPEEFLVADSVKWQDLFVAAGKHGSREEARTLAESLVDQARKGADFVKLVKDNDDGDSTLRDGDGVGSKRGDIKPVEAEPILFNLTDGQVGDVIELSTGFHVVKLVHRQKAGQLPFDETVQKRIRDKLRNEFFEREMKRIVRELKQKAVVVIAQNQQAK